MDERHQQVVSGAGLQESRINTEFVDFLSKWGPRGLYFLLAIVLVFLGLQQWRKHQTRQTDLAFADYEAQVASRNPDLLLQVASQHGDQPAVWALATRDAANILVTFATIGMNPGADPASPKPADMLSPEQRTAMFQKAESLYRDLLSRTQNDASRFTFAEQARWGIASTQLSMGKTDEARKTLEEFIASAESKGHTDLVALAKERLTRINAMASSPMIVAQALLPPNALRPGQAGAPSGGTVTIAPGDATAANSGEQITIQKIEPPTPTQDTPLPETETPAPTDPPANPGTE